MKLRSSLLFGLALAAIVPAAASAPATERQDNTATVVLTEGLVYHGEVVSLGEDILRLVAEDGKQVDVPREAIAYINFRPTWLAVRAYGTQHNIYHDFGGGYALPLPSQEWQKLVDSEGHLFLQRGKLTVGIYSYLARYQDLDAFLHSHAAVRQSQGLPEAAYRGGEPMTIAGRQARSFSYGAEIKGQTMLLTDIKVLGPFGQGCLISISGSGLSEEEFEQAKREALSIIQSLTFARAGGSSPP